MSAKESRVLAAALPFAFVREARTRTKKFLPSSLGPSHVKPVGQTLGWRRNSSTPMHASVTSGGAYSASHSSTIMRSGRSSDTVLGEVELRPFAGHLAAASSAACSSSSVILAKVFFATASCASRAAASAAFSACRSFAAKSASRFSSATVMRRDWYSESSSSALVPVVSVGWSMSTGSLCSLPWVYRWLLSLSHFLSAVMVELWVGCVSPAVGVKVVVPSRLRNKMGRIPVSSFVHTSVCDTKSSSALAPRTVMKAFFPVKTT
mmetsp:Transcript_61753/g.85075  ORF Transcript_61753/g.85075 Transcript_61753/m.85075 type:complete len:264 (+) Transcript_61753:317-1108(+)